MIDTDRLRTVPVVSHNADFDIQEVCYDEGELWKIEQGWVMIRTISWDNSLDKKSKIVWMKTMPASAAHEIVIFNFMSDQDIDRITIENQSSEPIL